MEPHAPLSGHRCYGFGPFVLDAYKSRLWKGEVAVALSPKVLDLLIVLVERAGTLVTKDEIMRLVWPGTVVEENSLAKSVSSLRKALDERRDQHDYVVTVPGQGYRFVASVERIECTSPTFADAEVASTVASVAEHHSGRAQAQILRHPVAVAISLAAVLVIVAGALWSSRELQTEAGAPTLKPFTSGPGLQHQPTWSPDGARIAFAATYSGNSDIWIQSVSKAGSTPLTSSPEHDWQPAWSPDGRFIAFRSERDGGGLYVVPAEGGVERKVTSFGYRPRWSPSSRTLLFSSSVLEVPTPELYTVGLDGLPPRRVGDDQVRDLRRRYAAWHPREDTIAVWGQGPNGPVFLTMPGAGGPSRPSAISEDVARRISDSRVRLTHFVWSPSGRYLYFEGLADGKSSVWRVSVDASNSNWIAGPERISSGTESSADLVLSPDGKRIALSVRSDRTRVWALPFDQRTGQLTGAGVPVTSGSPGEYDAAAPTDGSRLAFRTERGGQQELWERSIGDGQERLLIASQEWTRTSPRWSPDGRKLAYLRRSATSGRPGVALASIGILSQDTGKESLLTMPPEMELTPDDWSADGASILAACFVRATQTMGVCVVSSTDGGGPVKVLANDPQRRLLCPRFSPDQRWVSFMAVEAGKGSVSTLYVMPAAGGPWTRITEGTAYDDKPRWSADGRTLYFVSDRGGFANVWGQRFDSAGGRATGVPFQVTTFDNPVRQLEPNFGRMEIAVSKDRLFLPVTESTGEVWVLEGLNP